MTLKKSNRKKNILAIRATENQLSTWKDYAKKDNRTISDWARLILNGDIKHPKAFKK